MELFRNLGISEAIISALSEMGFEEPTPIQTQTIPPAMAGRDLIGQAQTGTGKTAAFGIPLIDKITTDSEKIQAIVLTPTRELAIQVAEELNRIGNRAGINTLPIYGGQEIERQIKGLKKRPPIIVATPGRLMDHMRRRTIRLDQIHTVILDEADEMLNMGFLEDIETILQETPETRQTLLFSATMPAPIQALARRFLRDPELISVKSKEVTVPLVEQYYLELHERVKFDVLCRLLDIQSPELAIIFGRTKRRVDELTEALKKRGYSAEGIHGDLTQSKRDTVIRWFRSGTVEILVATDVAARGLDITGVTHVYNFDIPQDSESYVHRIGRTGRAGQTGTAITFASPRELDHLRTVERNTKRKIIRMSVPTVNEAIEGQQRLTIDRLLQVVEEGDIDRYKARAEELLNETDSVTLLSAALKMLTKEPNTTPVKITEEGPLRYRRDHRDHSRSNKPSGHPSGQKPRTSFSGGGSSKPKHSGHSGRSGRF